MLSFLDAVLFVLVVFLLLPIAAILAFLHLLPGHLPGAHDTLHADEVEVRRGESLVDRQDYSLHGTAEPVSHRLAAFSSSVDAEDLVMMTAMRNPEITISPIDTCKGATEATLFTWTLKVNEDFTLDSYDHGDVFESVEEALSNACTEFYSLSGERHVIAANSEQEFKVTIRQGGVSQPVKPRQLHPV